MRVPRRSPALALAALVGLPVLSAMAQAPESRTIRGRHVAIYNLAGQVSAVPGSGDAVVVEITRRGADRERLRIEAGTLGDRETLRIVYPTDRVVYPELRNRTRMNIRVRENGTFGDQGWTDRGSRDEVEIRDSGSGMEAYADLVVRVPKGQKVDLFLAAGRMQVTNVEGDVLVDVGAAEVDINGTRGSLTLDTGSGRVSVRDAIGDLNIDAGSGGVTLDRIKGDVLRIDSGSGGVEGSAVEVREFNADVGSGGLRFRQMKATTIVAETGSGGVSLEVLSVVDRLDVETGSGGATIRLPAAQGAQLEAETGSGGFTTDFDITTRRFGRNHVVGTIGDGKARIHLEAGSGSVRLLKL
jgi:lia operon protein LiaG